MLLAVQSFVNLAGGVISFTHPASIRHSCGAQNTVTAHSLREKNVIDFDKKVDYLHKMQHFISLWNKFQQLQTPIIYPTCGDRSTFPSAWHLKLWNSTARVSLDVLYSSTLKIYSLTSRTFAHDTIFKKSSTNSRCFESMLQSTHGTVLKVLPHTVRQYRR